MGVDPDTRPGGEQIRRIAGRWVVAGLLGMAVTVLVLLRLTGDQIHVLLAAGSAVTAGSAVMLAVAPWRPMTAIVLDRAEIVRLTRSLRRATSGPREEPLKTLILDRPDELGDLSRAIHEALGEVIVSRRETRMLHRTMDQTIRKATHKATVRLKKQASTDPLTSLGNRRALDDWLAEALDESGPHRELVVMLLDLDHFKPINDTLGHDVGDRCLVFLADILKSSLRRDDRAARLGGDEFVVLMPDCPLVEARAIAERLRKLFGQMPWSHRRPARPGLSIGLANTWRGGPEAADDLLRRADQALYASKRGGRARVTVHEAA